MPARSLRPGRTHILLRSSSSGQRRQTISATEAHSPREMSVPITKPASGSVSARSGTALPTQGDRTPPSERCSVSERLLRFRGGCLFKEHVLAHISWVWEWSLLLLLQECSSLVSRWQKLNRKKDELRKGAFKSQGLSSGIFILEGSPPLRGVAAPDWIIFRVCWFLSQAGPSVCLFSLHCLCRCPILCKSIESYLIRECLITFISKG